MNMLERIRLIRNIGKFDSVSECANFELPKLTLIYAENGRGKTTLSAILRSLGTGDPIPISERHRLGSEHTPHVVVQSATDANIIFQNGTWTQLLPNLVVFDDVFVDQNVYSGLSVEYEHRQHLHELILGAQGVALGKELQVLVDRNEDHNRALRLKADAIPENMRGKLTIDEFCELQARSAIDDEIQAAERMLAAARDQDAIHNTTSFDTLDLPAFDLAQIEALLLRDLAALDTSAVARVQAHLASIGPDGEGWVADGMRRVQPSDDPVCPFCAQDLRGSPLIGHYRAYFSAAYEDLKREISQALADLNTIHGGPIPAAFERGIRVWGERRQFWSRFCDVYDVELDTAAIARTWNTARDAVRELLQAKQAAPLERITVSAETSAAVNAFDGYRKVVSELSQSLQSVNTTIRIVKEQAASGNPTALVDDIARLKAIKARHSLKIAALCQDYLTEKSAKAETQKKQSTARAALDTYRMFIFPSYQTAINLYLGKFGAGFRLPKFDSAMSRGGSACTYSVGIGTAEIPVAGTAVPGSPSFRSALSAGDRNTLALAFFFASLDQDTGLKDKVIVIDDPITSLDEHRSLTTVQEIGRLAQKTGQLIVLSHSKPFLCEIWESAEKDGWLALEIGRHGEGSTICNWNIHNDRISEHDRRHELLRNYLGSNVPDKRKVAEALRPVLEKFIRIAYPEHFTPGDTLGKFIDLCRRRFGTLNQILDEHRTQELDNIVHYANRFHHETNRAYETEEVNDGQLVDFTKRTLAFTRH